MNLVIFDDEIVARTVWMEARGEGDAGMLAVVHAIVNRWRAVDRGGRPRWYSGSTLAETCLIAEQFSCWNERDPNRRAMAKLADDDPDLVHVRSLVADAWGGAELDPTGGATHYYADTMRQPPPWIAGATFTVQIGHHRFYKDVA